MGKSIIGIILYLGMFYPLFAQVGINTIDPQAQLDIQGSNKDTPQIIDGILIPRIRNFPTSQPGLNQHGILVFLETESSGYPIGFYFWNHRNSSWTPLSESSFTNFYKEGTTIPSRNITDGIYRFGKIGIGAESSEAQLAIKLDSLSALTSKAGIEIENNSLIKNYVTYGIITDNRTSTSANKYGIKNTVSAAGRGIHYGIYNEVYQSTAEDMYGFYNKTGRTYGVSKNHYGIYSEIGTPLGSGMVYGIYSKAEGDTPERVYAGYFAGRVGIGAVPEEQYILPATKGKEGQILALAEDGNLEWKFQNKKTYTTTGTATGEYVIPDQTYTLEIQDEISSIQFPDASLNEGRIIILLAWNGISQKRLNFSEGEDLWDIATGNAVSEISAGERLWVQSTGTRWVVLGGDIN